MAFKGQLITKEKVGSLDLLDKKIFHILCKNARYSDSSIAKALKTKREIVSYRIKRLEKKDLIHGYLALIDSKKLGFRMYTVYFKFKHPDIEKEFLQHLESIPEITRYKNCRGIYDIQAIFTTKNLIEFDNLFEGIISKFSDYLKNYTILEIVDEDFTGLTFYINKEIPIKEPKGSSFENDFKLQKDIKNIKIDKKDIEILKILKLNAREQISSISNKVNLAPIAIKNRIKKLIQTNIIKSFFPLGAVSHLGYQWWKVFLKLRNVPKSEFIAFANTHKNILWYMKFVGEWNYQISVFAKSNTEFNNVLNEIREQFSDKIIDYGSVIILNQFKFKHRLD
jgi:Lrp/AsnC family transcriptional regulator, leucine-responsive regulatory protein